MPWWGWTIVGVLGFTTIVFGAIIYKVGSGIVDAVEGFARDR